MNTENNSNNNSNTSSESNSVTEQSFSVTNQTNQSNQTPEIVASMLPPQSVKIKVSGGKRGAPRKHFTKARKFMVHDDGSIQPCGRGRPSRAWKPEEIKTIDVPFDWKPGQEVAGYKLFVEEPID